VSVGRRIADHLALTLSHQRLSEQARSNEELRARTANLELLDDLLAALTDTGELSDLFGRISEIAQKVLPHDAVSMPVVLPDGQRARRYATAGFDEAAEGEIIPVPALFADADFEYDLIEDAS